MTADLRTTYLGLELANPIVPSASPLGQRIDTLRRLEDAGAAAVVLPSLFEEQIEHEELQIHGAFETGADSYAEALSYLPSFEDYNTGADVYLRHLEETKKELSIPVIASLNGISIGGWTRYARRMQEAGADALELNIYEVVTEPDQTASSVEGSMQQIVEDLKHELTIPISVKLTPFFTALANVARRLDRSGAAGLVLFNRFLQPDIDVSHMTVWPRLELSNSSELLLRLRWAAILRGQLRASLAVSGGVSTPSNFSTANA